jgi:hypothetical protein
MAKVRSPNFPVIDLNFAIQCVGKIYAKEGRGKFPQLSAATHLGYGTINGRSLGVLAALRAYGLVEGRGDDLAITQDAIALIEAPEDSIDRVGALSRAFEGPAMFNKIYEQYPVPPSEQTLRWWLIQQGFSADGADKAAQIYLDSYKVATLKGNVYKDASESDGGDVAPNAMNPTLEAMVTQVMPFPKAAKANPQSSIKIEGAQESLAMGIQERVLQSGMLSKTASYRVIVSGHVGEAEIERLLKKLEVDKEILAEPDIEDADEYVDLVS